MTSDLFSTHWRQRGRRRGWWRTWWGRCRRSGPWRRCPPSAAAPCTGQFGWRTCCWGRPSWWECRMTRPQSRRTRRRRPCRTPSSPSSWCRSPSGWNRSRWWRASCRLPPTAGPRGPPWRGSCCCRCSCTPDHWAPSCGCTASASGTLKKGIDLRSTVLCGFFTTSTYPFGWDSSHRRIAQRSWSPDRWSDRRLLGEAGCRTSWCTTWCTWRGLPWWFCSV